jgi:hydroxyacylglutathione hydrolase
MINIKSFVFNPFMENTYILFDDTQECIIVDPGCYETEEKLEISQFIEDTGLKVKFLINTHCHIDHVLGNFYIKEKYRVPLLIHKLDDQVLKAVKVYAPNYGFTNYTETEVDGFLEEGKYIEFGNSRLEILFVPGHAPGHIVLFDPIQKKCIGGDVLFRESIGRTDLPGGDHNTLINSIRNKMFKLPDETEVFPGHGPTTTIGYEKKNNPFCHL